MNRVMKNGRGRGAIARFRGPGRGWSGL